MILVTGATGNLGTELVKRLWARGEPVRAFVRNRVQARSISLPGIELTEGDFNRLDTITRSLSGVDRLFLLTPSSSDAEKQQRTFVDAAKRANVQRIVKLSQLGADAYSPARFLRYHGAIESHIRRSGLHFTFLRPNLFMQGLLHFRPTISAKGEFYGCAGHAKVSLVDVRDIAGVAFRTLTDTGHEGKTYEITGPESLTHPEIAEQLSMELGKRIEYVDVAPEQMREALLGVGMSPWQAEGVLEDYERYRRGEAAKVTATVYEVTGNEPTTFFQFAQDYAGRFVGKAAGVA
jgi:uncharacterized protein YbjT (DUF2867 family)